MEKLRANLEEYINNLSNDEKMMMWNEYCDMVNAGDNYIYSMDGFDELMNDTDPWEIARAAFFGDFNPTREYWRFNAYGNLESSDYPEDWMYIDEMIDYIIDNNEDFRDIFIASILSEAMSEEERGEE